MANRWLDDAAVRRGDDYDRRFRALAAAGVHVHGEADRVAAYGPRSVLDAGCGTGRVAIELARRGIDVVGVDLDPAMLAAARRKAPALAWVEADLATVDLQRRFDVVVLAGNVLVFVAPGTERPVVERMAAHLAPGGRGRLVAGFGLSSGSLSLETYDRLAADAGLVLESRWSTWEGEPDRAGATYAVSVHRTA